MYDATSNALAYTTCVNTSNRVNQKYISSTVQAIVHLVYLKAPIELVIHMLE